MADTAWINSISTASIVANKNEAVKDGKVIYEEFKYLLTDLKHTFVSIGARH